MDTLEPGVLVDGRYLLTGRIASGATSVVWRAIDEVLDRPVAVKVLHPHLADDPDLAGRFADEARSAAAVVHPALVAVYDTVAVPVPAIVLELVDGPDLRQRLDQGRLSVSDVISLGHQIADGLDSAHRAGLVHRDVKPANILCSPDGRLKLGDFGIATTPAGDRTATGVVLGTAKYLAPEQVRGDAIDARTDVYGLSVVLYESLCGRPPFVRAGDLPTALARLEEAPEPPRWLRPDTPTGLEAIVLRGLAREPSARWPTAGALRDVLSDEAARLDIQIGTIDVRPGSPTVETSHSPSTSWSSAKVTGGHRPSPLIRSASRPTDRRPPIAVPVAPQPDETIRGSARPGGGRLRTGARRTFGAIAFAAVALLGWVLVSDGDPIPDGLADMGSGDDPPRVVTVSAFDPDGSGPEGEHDELAINAIDDDPASEWHTESYENQTMGAKRGVGVIVELEATAPVGEVELLTDRDGWAVEIYVADDVPDSLGEWGPPAVVATGLERHETLRPESRGSAVLVWITDLGSGGPPYRLALRNLAIR